jgi:hypothetical protein
MLCVVLNEGFREGKWSEMPFLKLFVFLVVIVQETVFLSPLKSGRPVSCTYIKAEKAKYNSFLKSNTYGQCSCFADIYPVLIPLPFPVAGLAVTPSCTQL